MGCGYSVIGLIKLDDTGVHIVLLKLKEFVEENNLGEDLTGLDVIADVEFSENNLTLAEFVQK